MRILLPLLQLMLGRLVLLKGHNYSNKLDDPYCKFLCKISTLCVGHIPAFFDTDSGVDSKIAPCLASIKGPALFSMNKLSILWARYKWRMRALAGATCTCTCAVPNEILQILLRTWEPKK